MKFFFDVTIFGTVLEILLVQKNENINIKFLSIMERRYAMLWFIAFIVLGIALS